MSRAKQLADAEADAVEAADQEDETDPPATADVLPPDTTDDEAASMMARIEHMNDMAEAYLNTMRDAMGDDAAGFQPCPACAESFPGFVTADAPPMPRDLEGVKRCPTCNGYGILRTPSLVDGHSTQPCATCASRGYVEVVTAPAPVVALPVAAPTYPGADQAYMPLPTGTPDAWGRPAGHPHWGLNPAQIGA